MIVADHAVGSYPAFSPLLRAGEAVAERYVFCGTLLEVTLTGRYPAPCSVELGLSSRPRRTNAARTGDRLSLCDPGNIGQRTNPAKPARLFVPRPRAFGVEWAETPSYACCSPNGRS
jgi:hypothetical protein